MRAKFQRIRQGFRFGEALVEAVYAIEWRKGRGETVAIHVTTFAGQEIDIYVSPNGQRIRIFKKGRELR